MVTTKKFQLKQSVRRNNMYSFSNSILIVVFNYSNCLNNKEYLYNLYKPYFKRVIFYSDLPSIFMPDVNFVDIQKGIFVHNIFSHFYQSYRNLIEESDGLFYTMDDNIINVNILNLYRSDKIIYYYNEIKSLDSYSKWQWDTYHGKRSIGYLCKDPLFSRYSIDKFSGTFADWFYIPKRYLNNKLFDLFHLFAKHQVFIEISIPSIINNIEQDETEYQKFTDIILWDQERVKLENKNNIYDYLFKDHNLILHPIKFNSSSDSKKWLSEFFCKDKCVIITTINRPTETIIKHINNPEYDVIIVGDNNTPDDYRKLKCIYLDIKAQKKLFPDLCDLIPYNHYCRKNLGYLYAIKKGYRVIYETDDDNIPYDNFDKVLKESSTQIISETKQQWINIFKYFTGGAHIWPRGYPLSMIQSEPVYLITSTNNSPSIINGLVENDPDVDAIFRLACPRKDTIRWDTDKNIIIDNKNMCPFNTQNTFWINPDLFMLMLIPTTVSFRYCDILRGIISNIILKQTGNFMMYSSPNVIQKRNEHNLIQDFKSEYEMYLANETILDYIEQSVSSEMPVANMIRKIYENLFNHGIVKDSDMKILEVWLGYFSARN